MKYFTIIWSTVVCNVFASEYWVKIEDNGPIVYGASIKFKAELFGNDFIPSGTFLYRWRDNAIPQNRAEFTGKMTESVWIVPYSKEHYVPGQYEVEVDVYKEFIITYPICSHRTYFNITSYLNGEMVIFQNNSTLNDIYVSTAYPVQHEIQLHKPDLEFLKRNASSVITHWFVDCIHHGSTADFKFTFNYTDVGNRNKVEALVIASHVPLPPSTTTSMLTTTPIPSSTTKPTSIPSTSLAFNSSTEFSASKIDFTPVSSDEHYKELNNTSVELYTLFKDTNVSQSFTNSSQVPGPFICSNKTIIPDPSKTYGYFSHRIKPKHPVTNVKAEGNFWLQHGDLFIAQVSCNGTGPFGYCVKYWNGVYNITGNETCLFYYSLASCNFPVNRYLSDSILYTMVLIIRNDVSKVITPIGINFYEATKQPQLSVIIVPVFASIAAVVLIIFGVAFYIQSKRRYTIEVANFDFSHMDDMEYKTFRERLVESISNAFNNEEEYSEQDSTSPAPSSRKYGSMQ